VLEVKRRAGLSVALFAVGVGLLPAAGAHGREAGTTIKRGGTFRISADANGFNVDPAVGGVVGNLAALAVQDIVCARLMNYPDKPSREGFRLVPEAARALPKVSADGKTYTFIVRAGLRFSDRAPLRASAFARAINRLLAPANAAAGVRYVQDIVGAADVIAGRTPAASGVRAAGNRLVVRFTRPVPDFPAQTTSTAFCAVPPALPVDPEGLLRFAGSGPYYVARHVRDRAVELRRNPYYRGSRPRRVDRFVVDFDAHSDEEMIGRVERGQADWSGANTFAYFAPGRKIVARYGINRSRFFVETGLGVEGYDLNTSRALFRNNARLRRAVNLAVDRRALSRVLNGGLAVRRPTDQYLPPRMPGFRDGRIYPLERPNRARALALARGHTRSGRAVLYTIDVPPLAAAAQILRRDLRKIGLNVQIERLAVGAYFDRVAKDNTYDIAFFNWVPDYADPYSSLNARLDPRFIGFSNFSRFDSAAYNRRLRQAARLQGRARYDAYGRLDVEIARNAAPSVAVAALNDAALVSRRVDRRCVVMRALLDLSTVCLK
jgi:peptide/nickel transport system substrate-binding protein